MNKYKYIQQTGATGYYDVSTKPCILSKVVISNIGETGTVQLCDTHPEVELTRPTGPTGSTGTTGNPEYYLPTFTSDGKVVMNIDILAADRHITIDGGDAVFGKGMAIVSTGEFDITVIHRQSAS